MTDQPNSPTSVSALVSTPGPWYVRDLRASEMRRLGWTGPSIDRILITNKTGPEIIRDEGEDCIVARIQFDNRTEELTEGNLADAHLIAAAPELCAALEQFVALLDTKEGYLSQKLEYDMRAAIAKARGAP